MGAFGAEGGVGAVAGVDPGFVGEAGEEFGFYVVEEGLEVLLVAAGVADAAGEEGVAGEEVGRAGRVVVQEGDRTGVWPTRWITSRVISPKRMTSPSPTGSSVGTGMPSASSRPHDRGRAGLGDHLGEGLPVVAVLVGGDDLADAGRADQVQQRLRLVGGVDQHLLVGLPSSAAGTRCCSSARRRPC